MKLATELHALMLKEVFFSDYRFSHFIYFGKCMEALKSWGML